jgi:L-iditol 2-dehydrogenase
MRREATLVGTWNSAFSAKGNPDDWRTVVAAIANKTIDLAPLITHRLPLEGLSRGLQAMKTRSEPVTKVIINP